MKQRIHNYLKVALLVAMLIPAAIAHADAKEQNVKQIKTTEADDSVTVAEAEELLYESRMNEKVIVGKDTVNIILPSKNYGRYDRGLYTQLFVPKGQWTCGLQASYGSVNTEDLQMLKYIKDLDFSVKAYSFKPYISYFYRHNKAMGMRFGFSQTDFNLSSLGVDIDSDINFNLKDVYYHTSSFSGSLFHRNYIGLDRGRRFAVFNEVALRYQSGSGTFSRLYNDEPKETKSNNNSIRLDFSPGLCVFIHERAAFDVSFGIFGWYYTRETQVTNGTNEGTHSASGASFKFNLFNLNMGVAIYL